MNATHFSHAAILARTVANFILVALLVQTLAHWIKFRVDTTVPNQSLFTAGGTVGMRSFRKNGALRMEFEGRGRDVVGFVLDGGSEYEFASTFAKERLVSNGKYMARLQRDRRS